METMDYLNDYYGQYDEDGRLNRNRRGELEYLTTMGYIQAYLKPGNRVLEVGAGTGRYSLTFASRWRTTWRFYGAKSSRGRTSPP